MMILVLFDNSKLFRDIAQARSVSRGASQNGISQSAASQHIQELEKKLRDIFEQRKDKTMFIWAAGSLRYKDIVFVIDAAKGAGVEKLGIVTEGMRKAAGASSGN